MVKKLKDRTKSFKLVLIGGGPLEDEVKNVERMIYWMIFYFLVQYIMRKNLEFGSTADALCPFMHWS